MILVIHLQQTPKHFDSKHTVQICETYMKLLICKLAITSKDPTNRQYNMFVQLWEIKNLFRLHLKRITHKMLHNNQIYIGNHSEIHFEMLESSLDKCKEYVDDLSRKVCS